MKTFLLPFLFIGIQGFSQHIAMNQIDEFTDQKIIQVNASENKTWAGTDNIAKGLLNYVFLSSKSTTTTSGDIVNYVNLDISTGSQICLSEDNGKVIFLFENGEKITLPQDSKTDCSNRVPAVFMLTDEDLTKLSTNLISKFRVYTIDGQLNFEVKPNKKEMILNHFKLFQKTILNQ